MLVFPDISHKRREKKGIQILHLRFTVKIIQTKKLDNVNGNLKKCLFRLFFLFPAGEYYHVRSKMLKVKQSIKAFKNRMHYFMTS